MSSPLAAKEVRFLAPDVKQHVVLIIECLVFLDLGIRARYAGSGDDAFELSKRIVAQVFLWLALIIEGLELLEVVRVLELDRRQFQPAQINRVSRLNEL